MSIAKHTYPDLFLSGKCNVNCLSSFFRKWNSKMKATPKSAIKKLFYVRGCWNASRNCIYTPSVNSYVSQSVQVFFFSKLKASWNTSCLNLTLTYASAKLNYTKYLYGKRFCTIGNWGQPGMSYYYYHHYYEFIFHLLSRTHQLWSTALLGYFKLLVFQCLGCRPFHVSRSTSAGIGIR